MVTHVNTVTFQGIGVVDVDVQIHLSNGVPAFNIVGLPDKIVAESRERIRAAINSIGLSLPMKRIIVNLAPADLVKEGSHFDLPIALGLLVSMGILPKEEIEEYVVLGELGLDGYLIPVSGVLPAAIGASARQKGIICPYQNGKEAAWAGDIRVVAPKDLLSLINHFKGTQILRQPEPEINNDNIIYPDMVDIRGQETAKRALEIAAAGSHNLLMTGPPGAGKSMLASRLPGLLPEMDAKEILECSMVSSVAGEITEGKLQRRRPFRAPHHSCSMPAMVGGGFGKRVNPGEISLAHNGVLFLDELAEFPRQVLDSLRQPLETGEVLIARANSHVTFPARFQLIAAMNPCRCGYLSDESRACNKAPRCAVDYQSKISGPLLDRIDIHIDVPPVTSYNLDAQIKGESTESLAKRIKKVRDRQAKRYEAIGVKTNAELNGEALEEFIQLESQAKALFNSAAESLKISMRSYNRLLRVAKTIADLEEEDIVRRSHVAEALGYRQLYIKRV